VLSSSEEPAKAIVGYVAKTIILGIVYIVLSAMLIDFNKVMMGKDHFPFALPLVFIHTSTCFLCSVFLYLICPSLFPSLSDAENKVDINWRMLITGALPVALTMSASLVCSNLAYRWCGVAFLQMMKESNVVLVYCFALMASLETISWQKVQVMLLLVGATAISVKGEVNFVLMGFSVQAIAQVCECTKVTLQSMLLSGKGKLDPLSYLLIVMPFCVVVLGGALTILWFCGGGHRFAMPDLADLQREWRLLACNALLAFGLNLAVAAFMKHTSAVAVILVGIVKDATIVFFNAIFLGEGISQLQTFGFILQLIFVTLWSAMKIFPKEFEAGVIPLLRNLIRGQPAGGLYEKAALASERS
jgi:hypothetical protein